MAYFVIPFRVLKDSSNSQQLATEHVDNGICFYIVTSTENSDNDIITISTTTAIEIKHTIVSLIP